MPADLNFRLDCNEQLWGHKIHRGLILNRVFTEVMFGYDETHTNKRQWNIASDR